MLTLKTARDATMCADVASTTAALKRRTGEIYNVCAGRATSGGEIVEILLGLSRVKASLLMAEEGWKKCPQPVGDSSKLRRCSGWRPRFNCAEPNGLLEEWRCKVVGEVSA